MTERTATPAGVDPQTPLQGRLLWIAAAAFVALYAAAWPATWSIHDEQGYLSYALALTRGHLDPSEAGIFAVRSREIDGRVVPTFGLGTPALLAPAVALHWKAGFAVMALCHLLGFFACAAALRKAGIASWWALLYLFHPTALLFSRTLTSDIPAMALMMAGVWLWLGPRSRPLLAGLCWGLLPHIRFAMGAAVVALVLASAFTDLWALRQGGRTPLRSTGWLLLGLLPGLALLLVLNTMLYGGPLVMPATWPISPASLPANLARYLLSQNLIYPLLLVVALAARSALRPQAIAVSVALLSLYGCFQFLYAGYGWLGSVLIGDRFFLPLFAVLVVPYAGALERSLRRRAGGIERWVPWLLLVLGLAAAVAGTLRHQSVLQRQAELQDLLYEATDPDSLIVCTHEGLEYFFDGIAPRRLVVWDQLVPRLGTEEAAVIGELAAAGPHLRFVAIARTDRDDDSARHSAELIAFATEHFDAQVVAVVEEPGFSFTLLR